MRAPGSASSAMLELRAVTWPAHQRLEKRIDFAARLETIDAYRAHIGKMWGFHSVVEPRFALGDLCACLADLEGRRKVPLLERDLYWLGMSSGDIASLPQCPSVPEFDDPASAFGCAYVLEGATLGGQALMPLVSRKLGLDARSGAAYLSSYGDSVAEKWRIFGEALNHLCVTKQHRERAAAAATATFVALETWLCGPQM
jgi:heme oxygenase (biliverdin-IX-beta and delta-forming)